MINCVFLCYLSIPEKKKKMICIIKLKIEEINVRTVRLGNHFKIH